MPLSAHHHDGLVVLARGVHDDGAPRVSILDGIVDQVGQNLRDPRPVSFEQERLVVDRERQGPPAPLDDRPGGLESLHDHAPEVDRLLAQRHLAPAEPRNVKQVVDKARCAWPVARPHLSSGSAVPGRRREAH